MPWTPLHSKTYFNANNTSKVNIKIYTPFIFKKFWIVPID